MVGVCICPLTLPAATNAATVNWWCDTGAEEVDACVCIRSLPLPAATNAATASWSGSQQGGAGAEEVTG